MKPADADEPVLVRYRTREIRPSDLETIQSAIETHGSRGRGVIAELLARARLEFRHYSTLWGRLAADDVRLIPTPGAGVEPRDVPYDGA
jgi:hypothetical protein